MFWSECLAVARNFLSFRVTLRAKDSIQLGMVAHMPLILVLGIQQEADLSSRTAWST